MYLLTFEGTEDPLFMVGSKILGLILWADGVRTYGLGFLIPPIDQLPKRQMV
jgi:hypothetical protein